MSLESWTLRASIAAADVANYCDHIEHNEPAEVAWVRNAGEELRDLARDIAESAGLPLLDLYAERLAMVEARNVVSCDYDGATSAKTATTWRELQLVQAMHDRHYHPDVVGLEKFDQLRHYALHTAKLAGAYARATLTGGITGELRDRRIPDTLLFGLKLATVTGQKLDEIELGELGSSSSAVAA